MTLSEKIPSWRHSISSRDDLKGVLKELISFCETEKVLVSDIANISGRFQHYDNKEMIGTMNNFDPERNTLRSNILRFIDKLEAYMTNYTVTLTGEQRIAIEKEKKDIEKKFDLIHLENEQLTRSISKLQKEYDTCIAEVKTKDGKITRLELTLAEKEERLAKANLKVEKKDIELVQKTNDISKIEAEIQKQVEQISVIEVALTDYKNRLKIANIIDNQWFMIIFVVLILGCGYGGYYVGKKNALLIEPAKNESPAISGDTTAVNPTVSPPAETKPPSSLSTSTTQAKPSSSPEAKLPSAIIDSPAPTTLPSIVSTEAKPKIILYESYTIEPDAAIDKDSVFEANLSRELKQQEQVLSDTKIKYIKSKENKKIKYVKYEEDKKIKLRIILTEKFSNFEYSDLKLIINYINSNI